MDNKITKPRLSNFLQYEWIIMIAIIICSILAWGFTYNATAQKLSEGQIFKYYYDYTLSDYNDLAFQSIINNSFGFDVRKITKETLSSNYNVISTRLQVGEGDAIITDTVEKEGQTPLANEYINMHKVYGLNDLLQDCKKYLKQFLTDELLDDENALTLCLSYNNLDEAKIESNFRKRVKGDNRYLFEKDRVQGVLDEYERIFQLCESAKLFDKLFQIDGTLNGEDSYFYRFTAESTSTEKPYGLKLDKLKNGDKDASLFFRHTEEYGGSIDDVVLLIFNFDQKDLTYESVNFIATLIRTFSDVNI